jgi:hypothetical protein
MRAMDTQVGSGVEPVSPPTIELGYSFICLGRWWELIEASQPVKHYEIHCVPVCFMTRPTIQSEL